MLPFLNTITFFGNNNYRCLIFCLSHLFSHKTKTNQNIMMKHLFFFSDHHPFPRGEDSEQARGIHTPRGSSTQHNYFLFSNQENLAKNTPFPQGVVEKIKASAPNGLSNLTQSVKVIFCCLLPDRCPFLVGNTIWHFNV